MWEGIYFSLAFYTFIILYTLFFLSFLIFRKGNYKNANYFLSIFIIDCVLCVIFVCFLERRIFQNLLFFLDKVFFLFFGPIACFYAESVLKTKENKHIVSPVFHIITFFLFILISFVSWIFKNNILFIVTLILLVFAQALYYSIEIFSLLGKLINKIKNIEFSSEKNALFWVRRFMIFYVVIEAIFIVFLLSYIFSGFFEYVTKIIPIFMSISILLIGYNIFIQPEIFFRKNEEALPQDSIQESIEEEYLIALLDFFAKEKPYLNPDQSLFTVSKKLGLSIYLLTEIISKYLNKNFYDFLNDYRIEEAKKIISELDENKDSYAYIYSQVGFNSKVEFNNLFKIYTGMSPLQYRLRSLALKKNKTSFTVAVFFDNFYDPYEVEILEGIEQFAISSGIRIFYFDGGAVDAPQYSYTKKNKVYELAKSSCIDGIIIISSSLGIYTTPEKFKNFCRQFLEKPVVSIGKEIKGYPCVLVNNYNGMKELLSHLINVHNYKRIVFIRGPENSEEANSRFEAYKNTLDEFNIPYDEKLIIYGNFFWEDENNPILELINNKKNFNIDAIVAPNDMMAMQIIKEFSYREIKVPEEIAVVGFDNIKESSSFAKPLTTVNQPLNNLGYEALKKLLAMMQGEKVNNLSVYPTRLIVRQSCGCNHETFPAEEKFVSINVDLSTSSGRNLYKENLIMELGNLIYELFPNIVDKKLSSDWASGMVETLLKGLKSFESDEFLVFLEDIVSESIIKKEDIESWDKIISYLFSSIHVLSGSQQKAKNFLVNLMVRSRRIVDEINVKLTDFPAVISKKQDFNFFMIKEPLTAFFDIEKLSDSIAKNFPKLGIKSCFVCLFENNVNNDVTENSKLILSFHNGVKSIFNENTFSTLDLLPKGLKNLSNENLFVIASLCYQKELLGYVIFEFNNTEKGIFEILFVQLANAIKNIIQYENMKKLHESLPSRKSASLDKYKKSRLPKEIAEKYFKSLLGLLEREKIYKDMNLSLPELAETLGIQRNHLSFIINEFAKMNFYDFINTYRIEEAKRLLTKNGDEEVNVLEIAFDSGFNSKSTFNKVFKKFTGKTPSEYRKSLFGKD